MKFVQTIPVQELAKRISADLIGNTSLLVKGINEVHHVQPGNVTFVDHPKYYDKALQSAADIIIIDKQVACPEGKALLLHDQPFAAYNQLVWAERPLNALQAQVAPTAQIGEGVIIETGAVIGHHAIIGAGSYIHANCIIGEHSIIGQDVIIQANTVIGSDAFYYKKTPDGFVKWRSGGRVILEDNVDIGANCTINRGVSSDTIIGEGSKFDCQVQIGHDTKVGKRCLFAAQVGVAGNCHIGNEVTLYGQVGIAQNLQIGDKTVVLAKSGVSKDLEGGKVYFGYPAQEARNAYRDLAALRRLGR